MKAELTDHLYVLFRDLLRSRAGLNYPEQRRDDLAHGLSQALNASRHASLTALYEDVTTSDAAWDDLLVYLTVGETRFFRNEAHFAALRQHVLPELIRRRSSLRTLRIWSAGCASGEEPYSLAMLLVDLLPDIANWSISILGTDINPHFLQRGREALYSAWSFRETSAGLRERFFHVEQGRWRLDASIRRMVTFMRLNLAEATYPQLTNGTCALDMIVCRNVTIYFDAMTTRRIAERFHAALAPGGWLLVGHSEPHAGTYHQFETHNFPNAIFYRKALDAPLFATGQKADAAAMSSSKPPTAPANRPPARPEPAANTDRASQRKPGTNPLPAPPSAANAAQRKPVPQGISAMTRNHVPAAVEPAADEWEAIQHLLAQGDKTGAEPLLREFVQREPRHTAALMALGRLHADRGNWVEAQQVCEQILSREPLSVEAAYLLAQVYEHQDNLEQALAHYRRTIYINRAFVPGMLGMANIWRRMGEFTEARRTYRSLLRQLALLPGTSVVAEMEDATVGELTTFINQQLARLA